jgi:hypothetical protein
LSRFDIVALQEIFDYIGVGPESVFSDDTVRLGVVDFEPDGGGVVEVTGVGCVGCEGHENIEAGVVGCVDGVLG